MHRIFSTRQRVKILKSMIFNTEKISVNSTSRNTGLSKGLVSKYFKILTKLGVLTRTDGKLTVSDSSITKGIKILLNIESIDIQLFRNFPFVESVGLYGSCAKGENNTDSDIDIWIKIKTTSDENLASLSSVIHRNLENSKIVFVTVEKIRKMRDEDELFYHSLVFGSIVLLGDENGIQI
ncbi:MAG: nucleotidyltransferase domain-containing protein [Actinomycetia bacterium]|nr:nucleotidyltransferase domain-containing protein [Actinomycetes bacterium]